MAVAEIAVFPVGAGTDMQDQVQAAIQAIHRVGLRSEITAMGTNVEGDLEQILEATRAAFEASVEAGAPRVILELRIDHRTDKEQTLLEMRHRGEPAG